MQKGDILGFVIVGAIVVGLALFFAFAPEAPEVVYKPVEITGSSLTPHEPESDTVVPVDAIVKQNGFVTVHMSIGGAPGPIVGVSPLLAPGEYTDVKVVLSEPINAVDAYIAMLFVDDGDNVYEPGIDLPVMSDGQVVKQYLPLGL